jgi:hypothetical protein
MIKSDKFLLDMLDNDSNNIAVLNKGGHVIFLNQQLERWVMKYSNGLLPDNFARMITEYDRNRFTEALSHSCKTIEPHRMQIHLNCKNLNKSAKNTGYEDSEIDKDFNDELFEMQLVQTNWMNKKCVMVSFHLVQTNDYNESTQQLQSQSILHQINDLVLETCYKYERFKNIDICKNLRRVIQIDANDHSGTVINSKGGHIGFSNKNQFETVDHNKKFYRISLDVNFRSIDTVNLRPKSQMKRTSSLQTKMSGLESTSITTSTSTKGHVLSVKKSTGDINVKERTPLVQDGISPTNVSNMRPYASRKRDRLFMTHNKIYTKPVLKEIKEENKSENSESRSLLSKNQNSLDSFKKPASTKDLMMLKFSQNNQNIGSPDQPANEKVEVIKVITSKLCQLLGINARFEVEESKIQRFNPSYLHK